MLNSGYSVQEIIEYFKTYVPVKERIARKFQEYKELTEKLKNGGKIFPDENVVLFCPQVMSAHLRRCEC
jgi:hypothetical protein